MDRLLVNTQELKPEYEKRHFLWMNIYSKFCEIYAKTMWKEAPSVCYPLMIDIKIGTMRYYFYKYGLKYTLKRITNYHKIVVDRMKGNIKDINPDDFHIQTLLTDEESVNNQLDKEIRSYV